jgi:hypothetical protein
MGMPAGDIVPRLQRTCGGNNAAWLRIRHGL